MRKFEKISFEQFKNDITPSEELYQTYQLPIRKTANSAGYDFLAIGDYIIKPGEVIKIPTGIKVSMNEKEVLLIITRSSLGFKYNVRLTNQVGVIDNDYYNNCSNEGHIFVSLQNEGNKDCIINKNDGICQGIFIKYETVDEEQTILTKRTGGLGSTNKEEI